MGPKGLWAPRIVERVAAFMCSRSEDGRWVESSSLSKSSCTTGPTLSSRRANSVQRISISASRKTIPAAIAIEIRMTTPVARKSVRHVS